MKQEVFIITHINIQDIKLWLQEIVSLVTYSFIVTGHKIRVYTLGPSLTPPVLWLGELGIAFYFYLTLTPWSLDT